MRRFFFYVSEPQLVHCRGTFPSQFLRIRTLLQSLFRVKSVVRLRNFFFWLALLLLISVGANWGYVDYYVFLFSLAFLARFFLFLRCLLRLLVLARLIWHRLFAL